MRHRKFNSVRRNRDIRWNKEKRIVSLIGQTIPSVCMSKKEQIEKIHYSKLLFTYSKHTKQPIPCQEIFETNDIFPTFIYADR